MPQESYTTIMNILKKSTTIAEEFLCVYSNGGRQNEQNNKIFSAKKYVREVTHASHILHRD